MRVLDVMYNIVADKVMPIITQLEVLDQAQSIMGNPQNYAKKQTIGGGNPPQPFAAQPFGQSNVGYQSTGGGRVRARRHGNNNNKIPTAEAPVVMVAETKTAQAVTGTIPWARNKTIWATGAVTVVIAPEVCGPTGKVGTQYGGRRIIRLYKL